MNKSKLLLSVGVVAMTMASANARVDTAFNMRFDPFDFGQAKTAKITGLGTKDVSVDLVPNKLLIPDAPTYLKPEGTPKYTKALKVKTRDWGDEFSAVSKLFKQASDDRQELANLRERHIKTFREMQEKGEGDYTALAKTVTEDTVSYVQKRVDRIIEQMGPAPCEFSIFSLGSMPRSESCFYTDLEIGILMERDTIETRRYFTYLTQRLSDQLFVLGEHPDVGGKGLRIDEADYAPMHMRWFARWADPQHARDMMSDALKNRKFGERMQLPYEGSRVLLTTADKFAQFSDPSIDWSKRKYSLNSQRVYEKRVFRREMKKALNDPRYEGLSRTEIARDVSRWLKDVVRPYNNREILQIKNTRALLRNIMSIYGSDKIFADYMAKRDAILEKDVEEPHKLYQTVRQELPVKRQLGDMAKALADDKNPFLTGKLTDEIDLKRQFYRFPEQLLTNLGFYFNLGVQNTTEIARILGERGYFSKDVANFMQEWMNYATSLRMKQQAIAHKQGFSIPATEDEYADNLESLEVEIRHQQNVVNLYKASGMDDDQRLKELNKLSDLQKKLKTHKKHKPLTSKSILTEKELAKMKAILPKCQEIFQRVLNWMQGDFDAFKH